MGGPPGLAIDLEAAALLVTLISGGMQRVAGGVIGHADVIVPVADEVGDDRLPRPPRRTAVPAHSPMTLVEPSIVNVCVKVAPDPLFPEMVIEVAATDLTVPMVVFRSSGAGDCPSVGREAGDGPDPRVACIDPPASGWQLT